MPGTHDAKSIFNSSAATITESLKTLVGKIINSGKRMNKLALIVPYQISKEVERSNKYAGTLQKINELAPFYREISIQMHGGFLNASTLSGDNLKEFTTTVQTT